MFAGIDIGSRFTKVVVLEKKSGLSLVKAGEIVTPYIQDRDGGSKLDAAAIFKDIDTVVSLEKLRLSRLAVNLSLKSVNVLSVNLPLTRNDKLFSSAINEARRHMLPLSGKQHVFGVSHVGQVSRSTVLRSAMLVVRTWATALLKQIQPQLAL